MTADNLTHGRGGTNTTTATASGDHNHPRSYKIAPDERGPNVNLADVHRTTRTDSKLTPKGTSHFMFGLANPEKTASDDLTPFAEGFLRRCKESGFTESQFRAAVKAASALPDVAEELQCLTKVAYSTTISPSNFGATMGRLDARTRAVGTGSVSGAPGQIEKQAWGGAVQALKTKLPTVARYADDAWRYASTAGNAVKNRLGFGKQVLPASRRFWTSGSNPQMAMPLNPNAAVSNIVRDTGATARQAPSYLNPASWFTSRAGRTGLGQRSHAYGPVRRGLASAWNSPVGHTVRGAGTGGFFGGAANQMADFAGWEDHPDFATMGMMAGAGARFRLPGMNRSVANKVLGSRFGRPVGRFVERAAQLPTPLRRTTGAAPNISNVGFAARNLDRLDNLSLATGTPILAPGRYSAGKLGAGIVAGGTGAGVIGGMARARGEEAANQRANELVQQITGFNNVDEFNASSLGQFVQGYGKDGLLGGVRQYWNSLPPEAQMQMLLSGAGALGGAGLTAFTDHDALGMALMGVGGLGLAHGAGAFGRAPGDAMGIFERLDPAIREQIAPLVGDPAFATLTPAQQNQMLKDIVMQLQGQTTELDRASDTGGAAPAAPPAQ